MILSKKLALLSLFQTCITGSHLEQKLMHRDNREVLGIGPRAGSKRSILVLLFPIPDMAELL